MSYIGLNPRYDIIPFLERKPLDSFPKSILDNIKMLSIKKTQPAELFGSVTYRIQKYPGDVDLIENFVGCCSIKEVAETFTKKIQKIVKNIQNAKTHYYSEMKAGFDYRYNINIGTFTNGIYTLDPNFLKNIKKLYKENLLTDDDMLYINKIVEKSRVKNLNGNDYDVIFDILRSHRVLRWTADEILKGKKKLKNGLVKKLENAVADQTAVKIDMITNINGRFTEVTNFYVLGYEDEGELHYINLDPYKDIPISLRKEIEKLYYSNTFYSPFKMVKRMYSLSRSTKEYDMVIPIIPILSSNVSLLYQIKSELDAIIMIKKLYKNPSPTFIKNQLEDIKYRASTVIELPPEDLNLINGTIDMIQSTNNDFHKKRLLDELKELLVKIISSMTISFLEDAGLNPPPRDILPETLSYSREIVRSPYVYPEKSRKIVLSYQYGNQKLSVKFMEDPDEIAKLKQLEKIRIKKAKREISEDFDIPIENITKEDILEVKPELLHYRPSTTEKTLTRKEVLVQMELQKLQDILFDKYDIGDTSEISQRKINKILWNLYNTNKDVKKKIDKRIKGKTVAAGSILSKIYQTSANIYRKNYCDGKARPLYDGEYHLGCHNFTGPGTQINRENVLNAKPYNDIDNCSRTHDIAYRDAKGIPSNIRKADEEAIQCYDKFKNESGYIAARNGINGKIQIEKFMPSLIKSIAPNYSGGCQDCFKDPLAIQIKHDIQDFINKTDPNII